MFSDGKNLLKGHQERAPFTTIKEAGLGGKNANDGGREPRFYYLSMLTECSEY